MKNKCLIVIEGLDGSGKSTQFDLTLEKLKLSEKKIKGISFPDYKEDSSALVRMYLGGEFGDKPGDVNAYAASSFYAVDRYASYKKHWEKEYNDGTVILCARYATSNAIHQMVKLDESQWKPYLDWLEDYEYVKLGLPVPDLVIFLDMPLEIIDQLLLKRYNGDESKKDLHETDKKYLKKCRKAALFAAKYWSWKVISCANSYGLLNIEEINEKISKEIEEVSFLI